MFTSLLIGISFLFGSTDAAGTWSYHGDTGPENWAHLDGGEACSGDSQSPINIDTANVVEKLDFDDWVFEGYDEITSNKTKILNNGHTIQINLYDDVPKVSGGGLPKTYSALQFHFHWAEESTEGSEHTRNGNAYPLEMHIVHWNSQDFPFVIPAISADQGLAVLGVWIEVGEENPAFNPIIEALDHVKYRDEEYVFNETFRVVDLIPSDTSRFYRYSGSLTTPGCYESVVWTVFADTIQMSEEQIAKFRESSGNHPPPNPIPDNYTMPEPHPIDLNYRPVQPINDREVYASYKVSPLDLQPTESSWTTSGHPSTSCAYHLHLLLSVVYIVLRYL